VGDTLAGVNRCNCLFDPGDLPLIHVEIFVDGLRREERTAAAGVLCELFKSFFNGTGYANGKRGGSMGSAHMYTVYHSGKLRAAGRADVVKFVSRILEGVGWRGGLVERRIGGWSRAVPLVPLLQSDARRSHWRIFRARRIAHQITIIPPMPVMVMIAMAEIGNHAGNEPWPSLEWASWIFDRAGFVLIGISIFGLIATVAIVWMGIVKEHHWDLARDGAALKIAELNKETARLSADAESARAAIAEANARAAEATQKANEADLARARLEATVVPRSFSPIGPRAKPFAERMSEFAGMKVDIIAYGRDAPDARNLMADLHATLKLAGLDAEYFLTGPLEVPLVRGVVVAVSADNNVEAVTIAASRIEFALKASGISTESATFEAETIPPGVYKWDTNRKALIRILIGTKP
jgi:hypothetical protein